MDGIGSFFAHMNLATVATSGVGEDVGFFLRAEVTTSVGWKVGGDVGALVGDDDGDEVGALVGDDDGDEVGALVGDDDGEEVGTLVGFEGTAIICGFVFRAKVGDEVIGRGPGEDVG